MARMAQPPPLLQQFPPAKKRSTTPIILAVVGGVIFLAIIAAGAVGVFLVAKRVQETKANRAQAMSDLQRASEQARQNAEKTIKDGKASEEFGRLRQQLDKSAAIAGGSDAETYRAMSDTLAKIQVHAKAYETAEARFLEAAVLKADITDRTEIAKKQAVVNEFLEKNDNFADALRHSTDLLKAELDKARIPDAMKRGVISGFENSQTRIRPLQLRVRDTDRILGENALAALNLFDTNWGEWRHDATGRLIFQSSAAAEQYNDILAKVRAAAADEAKAQSEIITIIKATPASGIPPAPPTPLKGP